MAGAPDLTAGAGSAPRRPRLTGLRLGGPVFRGGLLLQPDALLDRGSRLGVELAAVFLIFTSQAWNMAFSFYQSLRTVPDDLDEACRSLRMSPWLRFWRVEVPFALPGPIWNMMMLLSGGWFFVVAA